MKRRSRNSQPGITVDRVSGSGAGELITVAEHPQLHRPVLSVVLLLIREAKMVLEALENVEAGVAVSFAGDVPIFPRVERCDPAIGIDREPHRIHRMSGRVVNRA
jgi:hypothetical protein